MARRFDCYFDYRSPFPFLALAPVAELGRRHGILPDWIPIRLPGLSTYALRPMGHNLPKRNAYVAVDMQRWAARRGVTVRPPQVLLGAVPTPERPVLGRDHPMDTERLLRAATYARARGRAIFDAFLAASLGAVWARGEDPASGATLDAILAEIGADRDAYHAAIEAPETAAALEQATREADGRGVFGVPTFFVDDAMFWGQDRLDFVEEALAARA
jgi:2-hydroxychromene-2-carboxylate isomerase